MGVVVPISNQASPFGELESVAPGAEGQSRPSEASLLMALQTMHKMGRFNQDDDSGKLKLPKVRKPK